MTLVNHDKVKAAEHLHQRLVMFELPRNLLDDRLSTPALASCVIDGASELVQCLEGADEDDPVLCLCSRIAANVSRFGRSCSI
jgi:hypothetical protein